MENFKENKLAEFALILVANLNTHIKEERLPEITKWVSDLIDNREEVIKLLNLRITELISDEYKHEIREETLKAVLAIETRVYDDWDDREDTGLSGIQEWAIIQKAKELWNIDLTK